MIVGIDEAGRGPLAGVVTACALTLKRRLPFAARDSKVLSQQAREDIFSWLSVNAVFGVGLASAAEIDKLNILQATFLAFNRAIKKLLDNEPGLKRVKFIIDGNHFRTNLNLDYTCLKGADKKIKEVSCASVVAKVVRDHLMDSLDFLYPQWEFSRHKGYPTSRHFSLIKKHSLTPFHRLTFSPCKNKEIFV